MYTAFKILVKILNNYKNGKMMLLKKIVYGVDYFCLTPFVDYVRMYDTDWVMYFVESDFARCIIPQKYVF